MEEEIKKENVTNQKTKKKHIRRNIVIIISLITFIVTYIGLRGSYLEMREVGDEYLSVFWQNTIYTLITFVINFVFLFFAFFFTNKTIKKSLKVFFDEEKKEIPKFPNKSISFVVALIGSILSTKILLNSALLCFSNSKFGITDPVFNVDLSLMIFQRPFISNIIMYLLAVEITTLAYAVIYSIIILNKSFDGVSRETITKCNLVKIIKPRVVVIAILVALMIVFTMVINIGNEKFMNVTLSDGSLFALYGAGKSDVTIKLVGYVIFALLAMISILKAYKAIKEKSVRRVVGNVLVVPAYLIILAVVLALYQLIFVGSDVLNANGKYIEKNIEYTKQAYGININENSINYSGTITSQELESNKNIINNIQMVDNQSVLQDLQSTQSTKGFYTFRNTQIEKYNVNNVPTLLYITPREISNSNASYSGKTYLYTHGYGAVETYAGLLNEDGYIKNLKENVTDTDKEPVSISEPRIYYGLETSNAAVINSSKNEIDYIDDNTNKEIESNYKGNAGLELNFIDRIILGIKEGDIQLAFSNSLKENSKILTNRNIINRAKSVMPYIKYDNNPYMVINDDDKKMYWVLDAYTVSDYYPFSQKENYTELEEINYIRNSIKVIVNAYDGTMKFYITDRNDPIAMAYNNMYPTLFAKAEESIPTGISNHFVYPKALFDIQSRVISKYHDIKSEVLYRGNDMWQVAETTISGKATTMSSYYTMCKNSDNQDDLGLIIPFTAYNKQNIIAYMVGNVENGKNTLKLNKFTSNSNVLGPIQIITQINQDETIAQDIASLNTTGTKISKNLIAVPINDTILYVETIYQQMINETTQKPTLKRVVVVSGNKIAIGNNLEQALKNLLSKNASSIEVGDTDNLEELVKGIIKANENVKNSTKNSDWKLMGEDMDKLTGLIDKLKVVVEEQEKQEEKENKENKSLNQTNNVVNK